jgi:transglutaminase-like putative cysteine protease
VRSGFERFLQPTPVIDWLDPRVRTLAVTLGEGFEDPVDVARVCFEWVRDRIRHTVDHGLDVVTCSASEVLENGTGLCYAKSHLLAALLRANSIPSGFVYQRLSFEDQKASFCLHGLNAVWLGRLGWYRIDPRGDRADLHAGFAPPTEVLPYTARRPGERLFEGVWADPVPPVLAALRTSQNREALLACLPDVLDLGRPDVLDVGVGRNPEA